jgi:4-aminobutyrate aminotransferase/(S)-3-amino-2-methylpropionate transaminase
VEGREYIDFSGGLGVLAVGHRHPAVLEAIRGQLDHYLHTCFHVAMYEPYVMLAERLNRLVPGAFAKKTMFTNSGAEAVENAVKIARAATGRKAVLSFEHAFHGRTLLGLSLTSKVAPYKSGFGPFALRSTGWSIRIRTGARWGTGAVVRRMSSARSRRPSASWSTTATSPPWWSSP